MRQRNRLKDIGEFGFINMINRLIRTDDSVIQGIGDDTAVLKYTKDKYLLFTCDMIIEDVHFIRKMKPEDIGYKALACNISDIASMGGIPKYAVISLGLPANLNVNFVDRIYSGIKNIAKKFHVNIVGGDTNKAQKIIINVALLGEVEKKNLVLRTNAKAGDWIFVSGFLGAMFNRNKHLNFIPRLKEARYLVTNYKINSMIDISDGLILDLSHILESSGVGAIICEEMIPKCKNVTTKKVLYTGEDYELLFSLSKKDAKRLIKNLSDRKNIVPFVQIGVITDKKSEIEFIDKNYRVRLLEPKGYRHF